MIRVRHLYTCLIYSLSYRCESHANHWLSLQSASQLSSICVEQFFLSVVIIRISNWKKMNSRTCFRWSYLFFSSKRRVISCLSLLWAGVDKKICNPILFFDFRYFCICWLLSTTAYHVLFIDARNSFSLLCLWLIAVNDRTNHKEKIRSTIKESLTHSFFTCVNNWECTHVHSSIPEVKRERNPTGW